MGKTIIFDFDGTLADTLPVLIDLYYEWAKVKVRYSDAEIEKIRNMTAQAAIKYVGIPFFRLPRLVVIGRGVFRKHIDEVKVFPGIARALADLKKQGHELYIMSSNSSDNIQLFLQKHDLDQYFTTVFGGSPIFGKAAMLKKITRRLGVSREDCMYVGDETRDIEGARKAGVPIISVTWGFNGKQILTAHEPDFMVDRPSELPKVIK